MYSDTIKIIRTSVGWHFMGKNEYSKHYGRCEICGYPINISYVSIIRNLKEAGLLNEDYLLLCCKCWKNWKNC